MRMTNNPNVEHTDTATVITVPQEEPLPFVSAYDTAKTAITGRITDKHTHAFTKLEHKKLPPFRNQPRILLLRKCDCGQYRPFAYGSPEEMRVVYKQVQERMTCV